MKQTLSSLITAAGLTLSCATTNLSTTTDNQKLNKCSTTAYNDTISKDNFSAKITFNRPFNDVYYPECDPYDLGNVQFFKDNNLIIDVDVKVFTYDVPLFKTITHRSEKNDVVCELYRGVLNCPNDLLSMDEEAMFFSSLTTDLLRELMYKILENK